MANRSYLFATDKIPANYEDRPETITGLSEWPYDIPIAYLLLVSQDTRVCASLSFLSEEEDNEPLALAGTAAGGTARLKRLLELLAGSRAGAADGNFLAARKAAMAFIAAHAQPFLYLETAEIDAMSGDPFAKSIAANIAAVRRFASLVDQLTPETIDAAIAPGGALAGVLVEPGRHEERELPALGVGGIWSETLWLAPRNKANFEPDDEEDFEPDSEPARVPDAGRPPLANPRRGTIWQRLRRWLPGY